MQGDGNGLAVTRRKEMKDHADGAVKSVCYSRDGKLFASGGNDNAIHLYGVGDDGEYIHCHKLKEHSRPVATLSFADDKHLFSGSWDTTIKMWDASTGKCTDSFKYHAEPVNGLAVSSNNKFIASCADDKTLQILPIDIVDVDELFGDIKHAAS